MRIVYTTEKIIPGEKSIFLAGPTIRRRNNPNNLVSWRKTAIKFLEELKFDGAVYIPENANDLPIDGWSYKKQIDWETKGLTNATVILFWVPRDKKILPGFTTNVEFGEWYKSGKVVAGSPEDSYKNRYLQFKANEQGIDWRWTLKQTLKDAVMKCNGNKEE